MLVSIFQVIKKESDGIEILNEKIIYVINALATNCNLIGGEYISPLTAYDQMLRAKVVFNETKERGLSTLDGKAFFHYVFSPDPNDDVSVFELAKLAEEICHFLANYSGIFQVVYAVHIRDVSTGDFLEAPHIHFIANNIDFNNGRRFNSSKDILADMKSNIDLITKKYNISAIRRHDWSQ
ncbi:MAG: hypothetical protein H6Q66_1920 [Firmicutes bacterium]|nr:hypothetical protein [Bacillota bacterium]